jgi:hypothetical protein
VRRGTIQIFVSTTGTLQALFKKHLSRICALVGGET